MSEEWPIGVGDIIETIALVYPDGFEELFDSIDDIDTMVATSVVVRDHIIIQFDCTDGILSHEEIGLPIVVDEDTWIDEISVADDSRSVDTDERMS